MCFVVYCILLRSIFRSKRKTIIANWICCLFVFFGVQKCEILFLHSASVMLFKHEYCIKWMKHHSQFKICYYVNFVFALVQNRSCTRLTLDLFFVSLAHYLGKMKDNLCISCVNRVFYAIILINQFRKYMIYAKNFLVGTYLNFES